VEQWEARRRRGAKGKEVVKEGGERGKWKEREGGKVTQCVSLNSPYM